MAGWGQTPGRGCCSECWERRLGPGTPLDRGLGNGSHRGPLCAGPRPPRGRAPCPRPSTSVRLGGGQASCPIAPTLSQEPQECEFYSQSKAPQERRCCQEGQAGGPPLAPLSSSRGLQGLWGGRWGWGEPQRQRLGPLDNVFPSQRGRGGRRLAWSPSSRQPGGPCAEPA